MRFRPKKEHFEGMPNTGALCVGETSAHFEGHPGARCTWRVLWEFSLQNIHLFGKRDVM